MLVGLVTWGVRGHKVRAHGRTQTIRQQVGHAVRDVTAFVTTDVTVLWLARRNAQITVLRNTYYKFNIAFGPKVEADASVCGLVNIRSAGSYHYARTRTSPAYIHGAEEQKKKKNIKQSINYVSHSCAIVIKNSWSYS